MRDDVPAALPLVAFAAALGLGTYVVSAAMTAAGLLIVAALLAILHHPRLSAITLLAALGLLFAVHTERQRSVEETTIARVGEERFATVAAPIERDWSERPQVYVLRASTFTVEGQKVRAPLAVYARFRPQPISMEETIRVEGHLRTDRRGGYTVSVKSARLMRYEERLSPWSPAAWNRAIANRLRAHAASRPTEIAMIEALLLGRGERLAEQTKEDFKRGGTYHLLVFSGLQISLAAALITMLLRWIGAGRGADWSLLGFALAAPAFIGPEASVSRASTAIALYAVSRIARRPTTFENLWCVAAIVRLMIVPRDLFEPAFHLTYAGAGALLFIGRPLARAGWKWVGYAAGAELAIVPLTLYHFHQFALGGSIATIAMTPVVFVMLSSARSSRRRSSLGCWTSSRC